MFMIGCIGEATAASLTIDLGKKSEIWNRSANQQLRDPTKHLALDQPLASQDGIHLWSVRT